MKIVIADELPASALEVLRAESGWTIDARAGRSPAALAADLGDADALIVRSATQVDTRLLEAAPQLRIVARAGTGVDNVDVAAASARGVLVVNAPGANSISVAEHTLALMLALARLVPAADRAMKDRRWEKKRFLGNELSGKTLGVAGLGRIGREVAQRARSLVRKSPHDPYISADVAAAGIELLTLDAVRDRRHVTPPRSQKPATCQRRPVRCVQTGPRLVNTARGELIDEDAAAPSKRHRQGAGLDVSSRSHQRTGRWRSSRRWSRRRISRRRPKRRKSSSARTPPRRCATFCAAA